MGAFMKYIEGGEEKGWEGAKNTWCLEGFSPKYVKYIQGIKKARGRGVEGIGVSREAHLNMGDLERWSILLAEGTSDFYSSHLPSSVF